MGDLRPDSSGNWPPEDGHGGLPDVPPEWGTIVIPDDAAELDAEADAVRRELRRTARRTRWRAALRLKPRARRQTGQTISGLPVMIMVVSVLTTLLSLFVVTWGPHATSAPTRSSAPAPPLATPDPDAVVPDLTLTTDGGQSVRLGTLLPAVVLLVDGCACGTLILDTAATVPAGITVVAVGRTLPRLEGLSATERPPDNVRLLADPTNSLRTMFALAAAQGSAATVIMIDKSGAAIATVPTARSVDDLRGGINRLNDR
jgi:hypothetical protein